VASKLGGWKALTNTAAPKFGASRSCFKRMVVVADVVALYGKLIFYGKKRSSAP